MRSGKFLFVIGSVLMMGLALCLAGCSSDSTSSANQEDPHYTQLKAQMNAQVDSTLILASNALQMYMVANVGDTGNPNSYGSVNPDSVVTSGTWYLVYLGDIQTAFTSFYLDSVQFRKGGVPYATPVNADAVEVRHLWRYSTADTTAAFTNIEANGNFTINGLKTNEATVNGTSTHQTDYRVSAGGTRVNLNTETTVSSLTFHRDTNAWNTGIPSAGTINTTMDMIYQRGDNAPDTTAWTIDATFNNGVMTATVTCDDVTRTYVHDLNPSTAH